MRRMPPPERSDWPSFLEEGERLHAHLLVYFDEMIGDRMKHFDIHYTSQGTSCECEYISEQYGAHIKEAIRPWILEQYVSGKLFEKDQWKPFRDRQITEVKVGPYHFTIIDSKTYYDGRISGRTFKMGGTYPDCANATIEYNLQGQPISAHIPYVMADPDCSKGTSLDRGAGSVMMLKAFLRHIHNKIPEITRFFFMDKSNIECGTEEEQRSRRHPKKGSYAKPMPLNYFSTAFNGYTWYEKSFGAMYRSEEAHAKYRAHINEFLTEEKMPPFAEFILQIPGNDHLLANKEMLEEVKTLYERANTFKEFFVSIPKERRCPHARLWLIDFVTRKLRGIFSHDDWFIDVTRMDEPVAPLSGGARRGRSKGRGRRARKRGDSFYVPRGFRREGGDWGHMIGVDSMEV